VGGKKERGVGESLSLIEVSEKRKKDEEDNGYDEKTDLRAAEVNGKGGGAGIR